MLRDIILCLFIGYVFGCFQTGYIYGRCHGIDIRNYGSGNAGTTNTLRAVSYTHLDKSPENDAGGYKAHRYCY